jgi:hypothetical protein
MGTAKIEITITSTSDMLPVLSEYIRTRPIPPPAAHLDGEQPEQANWVLVKGYHDSGTIDGVFGPYAEAHADWLLGDLLGGSTYGNWTKVKLSSGPEEA